MRQALGAMKVYGLPSGQGPDRRNVILAVQALGSP